MQTFPQPKLYPKEYGAPHISRTKHPPRHPNGKAAKVRPKKLPKTMTTRISGGVEHNV